MQAFCKNMLKFSKKYEIFRLMSIEKAAKSLHLGIIINYEDKEPLKAAHTQKQMQILYAV